MPRLVTRTVYASFSDAMKLVRKAKQKKIAYSYWELEELSEAEADVVLAANDYISNQSSKQKYPTVKNFSSNAKVSRKRFKENPVKITFFLEKSVDLKQ